MKIMSCSLYWVTPDVFIEIRLKITFQIVQIKYKKRDSVSSTYQDLIFQAVYKLMLAMQTEWKIIHCSTEEWKSKKYIKK